MQVRKRQAAEVRHTVDGLSDNVCPLLVHLNMSKANARHEVDLKAYPDLSLCLYVS